MIRKWRDVINLSNRFIAYYADRWTQLSNNYHKILFVECLKNYQFLSIIVRSQAIYCLMRQKMEVLQKENY